MKEVYDFLKAAGTYYLATFDGKSPRVRPFGTVALFEDKIYVQTGKRKEVAGQMKAFPQIEICAFLNGKWLRVSAEVVLDERIEAQRYMLEQYPELGGMYKAGDGNTEVYFLKNAVAVFSSFTEPPRTVKF